MIKNFLKQHYLVFCFAILVGFIYVAPNIFFILSLGEDYKGIPMMQTANEISYLARIREILDGHPMLGSPFFYEYKNQWPIAPPTGEIFYAIPSIVFGTSPQNIVIASRFFLPLILFFLVYFLIYKLSNSDAFFNKINGVAGALLITLGYDLVDYHTLLSWIAGESAPGGFLIWARPVNPILGAIFLMSFLLFIWSIIQKKTNKKTIIGASVFLVLMIMSYFFSWGMAVSVVAMLILIYFFKKEYGVVKNLAATLIFGFLLASPYWYISWQASQSSWYEDSLLRSGLFYTHYPLLNKLMLAVLAVYIILIIFQILKYEKSKPNFIKEKSNFQFQDWHWFCLALILGSLWAYSQQILTGRTVWPYHFVQYSIPLAMIVLMVLFYNIVRKESVWLWRAGIFAIVSVSLSFGIYTQASVYNGAAYEYYRNLQLSAPLFDELNKKEKDCVVLVKEDGLESKMLNVMIPAFTHCNRYSSTEAPSLMPSDRQFHSYLVALRLNSVSQDTIEEYLQKNQREAMGHLYSNWLGVFGYPANDFPDFSDPLLEQRLKEFPDNYRQFMARDFRAELDKYRLDYVLSVGLLPQNIIDQLGGVQLIFNSNNLFLYNF